jgi:PAS domain S-box-containing protein
MGLAMPSAGRPPTSLRPVLIYAVAASLWILLSDVVLERAVDDGGTFLQGQTLKGWLFVLATSGLLYALIRRDTSALRQSEVRHRTSLECMADAVMLVSPAEQVVVLNRAAQRLVGLEEGLPTREHSELVTLLSIQHPDGRPVSREESPTRRALRGETVQELPCKLRRPNGEWIHLSVTATPVRQERTGRVELAVVVLRDMTELRRLEQLRDEFLSTAAHELKTPIATIKGYVQLLERWAPGGHEPREGKAFQVLIRQCDRLNELVQELLEVSRLQLRRLTLNPRRVELGTLVADVVERLQATTRAHTLVLEREGDVAVEVDRERIDQVLVNLLDNAIKFSPEGGAIRVRVGERDGMAVVSIQDPGMGIPKERQGQVFQRFYRAHEGLASDRGGMGIGLHLSEQLIQSHGGRLWFESEEGKGSTFSFSLALAEGGAHGGA